MSVPCVDVSKPGRKPVIRDAAIREPPKVCIVDDDLDVADSLKALFLSRRYEVRSYARAEAFLVAWAQSDLRFEPAILLFGHCMPGLSGVELFARLQAAGLPLFQPVIFLAGSSSLRAAVCAMRRGAFDFIQKPFIDDLFLDRVSRATEIARSAYPSAIRNWLFESDLTARERDVACRVAAGCSSRAIAIQLGLSSRTVDAHRANIYSKLGIGSRIELISAINGQWRQTSRYE